MAVGASLEPIPSSPGAKLTSGHSDAIILWKNRQMSSFMAKKKNTIPKPAGKEGDSEKLSQCLLQRSIAGIAGGKYIAPPRLTLSLPKANLTKPLKAGFH